MLTLKHRKETSVAIAEIPFPEVFHAYSPRCEAAQDSSFEHLMTAESMFINTGTRTSVRDLLAMSSFHYFDSESITELDHVPEHLVMIGGGYPSIALAPDSQAVT